MVGAHQNLSGSRDMTTPRPFLGWWQLDHILHLHPTCSPGSRSYLLFLFVTSIINLPYGICQICYDKQPLLFLECFFSSHDISMPKGLYFTAVVFFLSFFFPAFFSMLDLWVTERISTKLAHIFTYDCYLKTLVRTIPLIWDRLWYLTEHDINNRKKTCQSTGTPLHAPKFGELWSVGEFLPTPTP